MGFIGWKSTNSLFSLLRNCIQQNDRKCKFSFDSNVLTNALKEDTSICVEIAHMLLDLILVCLNKRFFFNFTRPNKPLGWPKPISIQSRFIWRSSLYEDFELDFIFYILLYASLDEDYDQFEMNTQTKAIFNEIISAYTQDQWQIKVRNLFTFFALLIIMCIVCRLKKIEFRKSISEMASSHFHILVYLNNYFEITHNERIRDLSFSLAFDLALDLLVLDDAQKFDVEPKLKVLVIFFYSVFHRIQCLIINIFKFSKLLAIFENNCYDTFISSSYKMFAVIKCIDSMLSKFIYYENTDRNTLNVS